MLTVQIENPELERYLDEEFHGDKAAIAQRFMDFLKTQRIKNDVKVSTEEFRAGEALTLKEAFAPVLEKYGR